MLKVTLQRCQTKQFAQYGRRPQMQPKRKRKGNQKAASRKDRQQTGYRQFQIKTHCDTSAKCGSQVALKIPISNQGPPTAQSVGPRIDVNPNINSSHNAKPTAIATPARGVRSRRCLHFQHRCAQVHTVSRAPGPVGAYHEQSGLITNGLVLGPFVISPSLMPGGAYHE